MADTLLGFEVARLKADKAARGQRRVVPLPVVDPPSVPDAELRAHINRLADGRVWIWLPVEPVGAVRQTQADRWKARPAVLRYRDWRDRIRILLAQVDIPAHGGQWLFLFQAPRSWSKRRKADTLFAGHTQKPDADNCLKAVLDVAFTEDAHIWDARVTKRWWRHPGIVLILPGAGEHP